MERKRRGKKVLPPPPPSNRGRGIAQHQRKKRKEKGIGPFSIHEHFPTFFREEKKREKRSKKCYRGKHLQEKKAGKMQIGWFLSSYIFIFFLLTLFCVWERRASATRFKFLWLPGGGRESLEGGEFLSHVALLSFLVQFGGH